MGVSAVVLDGSVIWEIGDRIRRVFGLILDGGLVRSGRALCRLATLLMRKTSDATQLHLLLEIFERDPLRLCTYGV
jgi:hypothetical protein